MTDVFSKRKRSEIMSKIRSKNTLPERMLRREFKLRRLQFKEHANLFGRPDFIFPKTNVAVFVDGDFWHGRNWKKLGKVPPKRYWQKKITRNIKRDKRVNRALRKNGWKVVRIWESSIKKNAQKCAERVMLLAKHNK